MSFSHDDINMPSLRAIRAIEAVVRLGSFTKAAGELNVTQGAISRQIQELERLLAVKLFLREGPKLMVTETGRAFATSSAAALDIIADAARRAKNNQIAPYVTLSMLPSVASKWLAPRLGRFIEQHPQIDLRVSASRTLVNFHGDGIDAAIRYGQGRWAGLNADLLGREMIFPVCTAAYADKHRLTDPVQLTGATLFHADIKEDWAAWFEKAGIADIEIPRGPRLGDDAAILQAAIDGQGVALGRSVLVADDLKTGRLIAPFETTLKASYSYWFVTPATADLSPDLANVRKWIRDEFRETEA